LRAHKQLLAVEYNIRKILLAWGSSTVDVPGNEDRRHAFEREKKIGLLRII